MNTSSDPMPAIDLLDVQHQQRDIAIDYLRASLIILVVFLHAALAYTSFSTYDHTRWVNIAFIGGVTLSWGVSALVWRMPSLRYIL